MPAQEIGGETFPSLSLVHPSDIFLCMCVLIVRLFCPCSCILYDFWQSCVFCGIFLEFQGQLYINPLIHCVKKIVPLASLIHIFVPLTSIKNTHFDPVANRP